MSAPTIESWVSSTGSVLRNSTIAREFHMPDGWNKMRVGLLCGWNSGSMTDLTGYPAFSFGICSGSSNIFGDSVCGHYIGLYTSSSTWTWEVGANTYYYGISAMVAPAIRKDTNGLYIGGDLIQTATLTWGIVFSSASVERGKLCIFLDITKGTPNYTLQPFYHYTTAGTNDGRMTIDEFLAAAQASPPAFPSRESGNQAGVAQSIPVDEVASGSFNAVNISWNREHPSANMIIFGVVVVKLA